MQTGNASFINGLSTDSTSQLTVNDQQKLVLYGNAVEYAKTNNIQLGQALTPEQVAGLSQPMLWYVEQTVPEPGCAATGNAKCPTVTALMPQVYLPENFTALSAGGQILASNDLSLNFGSTATGGSILNTGSITSGGTLTVNTGTLTNRANVVDVGEIWSYIKDAGYLKTTGTMVQPGGFMSAAAGGLTLNVDQFNQIGGALQLLGQNGEVDQAATQAFIAGVAAQLGDNFVQQTLQNDLHTDFVKQGGDFGIQQIGMLVIMTMTVIATQGASLALASAETAAQQAALDAAMTAIIEGGTAAAAETAAAGVTGGLLSSGMFAAGTLGNAMASAFAASAFASAASQVMTNGKLNFGDVLTAGAASALTAGLTRGITYSDADGFGFSTGTSSDSLANLAGTNPSIAEGIASNAVKSTASDIARQLAAMAGVSAIQAGVQSAIQGGSFLEALKGSGISNLSAALAYQIGSLGPESLGQLGYVGAHAALGCASSSALGTGCGGGAIGAATSAVLTPLLRDALYNGSETVTYTDNGDGTVTKTTSYDNPAINASIALIAGLSGASLSGVLGQNPNGGVTAAQNEATNNALSEKYQYLTAQKQACSGQAMSCFRDALTATQAAYIQAKVEVSIQCATGGDNAACQIARNDVAQLYLNGQSLQQFVQSTPDCQTTGCVAATTVGSGLLGLLGGWALGRLIAGARGIVARPGGSASGTSASGEVANAGDVDLPNVYGGTGAVQRVSNGVTLNPNLPDPIAGLNYRPAILNSSNPNIANSQLNGYVGKLNLANKVASLPDERVVSYGGAIGTHGADVVSVN